jgi:hypothetical protein
VRGRPAIAAVAAVALAAAALAGCAGEEQSGTPAHRVAVWVGGAAGGTSIGTVDVDTRNVARIIDGHNSSAAVKEACALLTNDAETAVGNLPTPDTDLTDDLNNAYTAAAAAGDDCYDGPADRGLLAKSARERTRFASLMAVAVNRIVAVTGKTPPTSTTQPSGANDDPFAG